MRTQTMGNSLETSSGPTKVLPNTTCRAALHIALVHLIFEPLSQVLWSLQASWDPKRPFSRSQASLYDAPAEKTIPPGPGGEFSQESHLLGRRDWERNFRGKPFRT